MQIKIVDNIYKYISIIYGFNVKCIGIVPANLCCKSEHRLQQGCVSLGMGYHLDSDVFTRGCIQ